MITEVTAETIGEALEWSYQDGWASWQKMHTPHMAKELAWTERVKKIQAITSIYHRGFIRITVKVEAQKPWESETFVYGWQKASDKVLILRARN